MTVHASSTASASPEREFSSFRDPAGYLFWKNGEIFRRVLRPYERQFQAALGGGLFDAAKQVGLLLPFSVIESGQETDTVAVIKPELIPLVTYPYEWSFEQLKTAALTTLDLHLKALEYGMLLKDASAYNVQFVNGEARFIDHLSFDFVTDYPAWPAYGQFCRHFLAPLALMSRVGLSLGKLSQLHIDGIPLDLAASLLPRRTKLHPGFLVHLHLHATMQERHSDRQVKISSRRLTAKQMSAFSTSLRAVVSGLEPKKQKTEWGRYYEATNYSETAFDSKKALVRELIGRAAPKIVWDVGGNNGEFSRSIADLVQNVVCMDIDPSAVNQNYRICRDRGLRNVLPLIVDLTNPTPAVGFANEERPSLSQRGRPDVILALALIHHLAISNNLPFAYIAKYFAKLGDKLLIEFVEKSDSQVQRLLINRKDIFTDYNQDAFKEAFQRYFHIEAEKEIPDAKRTLFLFYRR